MSSVEMSRDVKAVRLSNVLDVHVTVVDGGGLADEAVLFNSEVADGCVAGWLDLFASSMDCIISSTSFCPQKLLTT